MTGVESSRPFADLTRAGSPSADPYGLLGVARDATAEEVRRAYFRLVRQTPPETHPEEFQRVRAAYETLRSPMRRAELALETFDETMAEIDLDLVAGLVAAEGTEALDPAALLLAVELGASDLVRTEFPEDLMDIDEATLGLVQTAEDRTPDLKARTVP
jgi:hypothetical protein